MNQEVNKAKEGTQYMFRGIKNGFYLIHLPSYQVKESTLQFGIVGKD